MSRYNKDYCFILTGAMGSGKSTIFKGLRKLGLIGIGKPARQMLRSGKRVPWIIHEKSFPQTDPRCLMALLQKMKRLLFFGNEREF